MRNVGRLHIDAVRHRERQVARNGDVERGLTLRVEREVALQHVAVERRRLFRPEPLAPEPIVVPSLRLHVRDVARNVGVQPCRPVRARRRDSRRRLARWTLRSRRRRLRAQAQRQLEVRRLELGDAQRTADVVAVRAFGVDGVIAQRLLLGKGYRQREHAVRVGLDRAQRGRSHCSGPTSVTRYVAFASATTRVAADVVGDAGELAAFAGLVHLAVGENRAARERRSARPSSGNVEAANAAPAPKSSALPCRRPRSTTTPRLGA